METCAYVRLLNQIFVEFIEKYFVSGKESLTPRHMTQNQSSATEINLEKIILYPIKSCEGMEVDEWEISEEGKPLRDMFKLH